jgi:ribosomal protein S18 acetylase RimI-like enzyme
MYTYRLAHLGDVSEMAVLGRKVWSTYKLKTNDENWKKVEATVSAAETYTRLLNSGQGFVCEEQTDTSKKLVGMAFAVWSGKADAIYQADWCQLRMVSVDAECSGNGIGKSLTKMALSAAQQRGELIMALHTAEVMLAAQTIYSALGFNRSAELEPRFGWKYWLFIKELQSS